MKQLLLLIAIALCLVGCAEEPDYYAGREPFLREAEPYAGVRIMHLSDVHGDMHRLEVMLNVAATAGADLVVNTGDDTNGLPGDESLSNFFAQYRATVDRQSLPVIGVQGNHDAFCTRREYREQMFDKMPGVIAGDTVGAYGYYDHGDIRFILLDPRDCDEPLDWWSASFSPRQIDWLKATLEDACAKDLGVVTVMHYGFGDNREFNHHNLRPDINFCEDPFRIPALIDSMQANCGLDYIAHLCGHLHSKEAYWCARADGSRSYGVLMLCEASLSRKGTALDGTMRRGDDDIAASLLIINRRDRQIHRISYGAYLPPRHSTFNY